MKQKPEYNFTEEDIRRERVERGLSWRQVAINLELKTPDQARKAWVALTGTPHNETEVTARKPRGTAPKVNGVNGGAKTLRPMWDQKYIDSLDDAGFDLFQDEVREAITGKDITVERTVHSITIPAETLRVSKVERFSLDKGPGGENDVLVVHLFESRTNGSGKERATIGVARAFRVRDIRVVQ